MNSRTDDNNQSDSFLDEPSCFNLSIDNSPIPAKSLEMSIAFDISLDDVNEPVAPLFVNGGGALVKKLNFENDCKSDQESSQYSLQQQSFDVSLKTSRKSDYFTSKLSMLGLDLDSDVSRGDSISLHSLSIDKSCSLQDKACHSSSKTTRLSEDFRNELTKLDVNLSSDISFDIKDLINKSPITLSLDNYVKSSCQEEAKSCISNRESCNSNFGMYVSNDSDLKLDTSCPSLSSHRKSTRFSNYFRNEIAKISIAPSPNVSLDIKNDLDQSPVVLSLDNTANTDCNNDNSTSSSAKTTSSDICGRDSMSTNTISHNSDTTDSNCHYDTTRNSSLKSDSGVKSANENIDTVSVKDNENSQDLSIIKDIKLDDESDDSFVFRNVKKSTAVISSDDEKSYGESINDIKNSAKITAMNPFHDNNETGSDDMSDFVVDDDVIIYEDDYNESSDDSDDSDDDEEISLAEISDDLTSEDSEKENDCKTTFVTPQSHPAATSKTKDTKFYTPRKEDAISSEVNRFQTPTSFCYPATGYQNTSTPVSKRRTLVAPPLSVVSKTGTPASANPTFKRNMLKAARELFVAFNKNVFSNQLPDDLEIKLNKRLNTTAGRCVYLRKLLEHRVYIELSPKVVDCFERLKETLAHELCHAATFIVDKKMDNHGPLWRRWAKRVNDKYPELPPVTRCHSYEISYKYNYRCTNTGCAYKIGRYTKSIDLKTARCPYCYLKLYIEDTSQPNNGASRPLNPWTDYVKKNFSRVKESTPSSTAHKDIMKLLSDEFKSLELQKTN